MKQRNLFILGLFLAVCGSEAANAQVGGLDFYRVKSALLAERRTFDFRLNMSMLTTDVPFRVPINSIDTLTFLGPSTLGELRWSVRYALNPNWEIDFSGISFLDQSAGAFRYGAGDTRIGIRYATPNIPEAESNMSANLYYSFPSGFD